MPDANPATPATLPTAAPTAAPTPTPPEVLSRSPGVGMIALPCMVPQLVPREKVRANDYNPNSVSPDKMALLEQSIRDNGFCFPVVTIYDPETDGYVIIDGFHRYTVMGPEYLDLPALPVVVLPHDMARRLYATVQFNKARGHHQVDLDAEVIRRLLAQGQTEEEVSQHLGIDLDTVHRYKQVTGIAEIFSKTPYSLGWEMEER